MPTSAPRPPASAGQLALPALLALLALLALAPRLAALAWNTDRLFGDVNLFALVARAWLDTGELSYPGKYDFAPELPYLDLAGPVSQHPPAWSWLGGALASLLGTRDTYLALQLGSLAGGLLVVAAGAWLGALLAGRRGALFAGGALALHPYLVDYSANGSPYLWVGLALLVVPACALARALSPLAAGALAGFACAAAASVHGLGLALVPAGLVALLLARDDSRARLAFAYLALAALTLLPTALWMRAHFGSWWHSTTVNFVYSQFRHLEVVMDSAGLRVERIPFALADVPALAAGALVSTARYALHLACELGWAGLLGLGAAFVAIARRRSAAPPPAGVAVSAISARRPYEDLPPRLGLALLLLVLAAGLPCWLWPSFKYRFLAGLLPLALVLVAFAAARAPRLPRWALLAPLGALLFWGAQIAVTGEPHKYYAFDRRHAADYAAMRRAAALLADLPPGPVLGFADRLDGGTEAAYWHGKPFVAARRFTDDQLRRLVEDFQVRYLYLGPERRHFVETHYPAARLDYADTSVLVYTLRP